MPILNPVTFFKKKHNLSYKLLVYVVICSSTFTFLATCIQLYFDYRKDIDDVDRNFTFIEQTMLPPVILNVYALDMEQLGLQIRGLLNMKNVAYVEIVDADNIVYQDGNVNAKRDIVKTYPLNYSNNLSNKEYYVGTLTIVISLTEIYTGIVKKFIIILISNGVKMFMASFVILMIIQQIVTRHINTMVDYTHKLDPGLKNEPLKLQRPDKRNNDELDQLAEAINYLQMRVYSDIKKRIQAEVDLKNSENQFRTLAESTDDIIMRFDKKHRLLYVNPAVSKISDTPSKNFIDKTLREVGFPEELVDLWDDAIEKTFSEQKSRRLEFQIQNDIWIDWLLSPEVTVDGEVNAVITSARDITHRKHFESELSQLKAFSENIINSMPSVLIGIDQYKKITHWNHEAEKTIGIRRLDAQHKKILGVIPALDPFLISYWEVGKTWSPWKREKVVLFDDPVRYYDIIIYSLHQQEGDSAVIRLDDVTHRVLMELEIKNLNADLEERVEQRTEELQHSISELRHTQDQLVQSEKMAALGGLVAGISHEINTPLGLGVTESTFLKEISAECLKKYKENKLTQSNFEEYLNLFISSTSSIYRNLERTGKLISSFKQVAVDQVTEEIRIFNIKNYLEEILLSLTPRLKKTPHIVKIECPEKLKINSYPGVLSQIITNFVINSLNHGLFDSTDGVISIIVRKKESMLELIYKDNGVGMSDEEVKKVFDPFFTTKRGQGGTGLGMHIVFNLIDQKLNGRISCVSSPGNGVEFMVQFPADFVGI